MIQHNGAKFLHHGQKKIPPSFVKYQTNKQERENLCGEPFSGIKRQLEARKQQN